MREELGLGLILLALLLLAIMVGIPTYVLGSSTCWGACIS